jgi:osmotically-inducible protein OsmY
MSGQRAVPERRTRLGIGGLALAAMATLGGCAVVVVGATVGAGTLVAMDRRSASVVQSDQGIEQKVGKAVTDRWPGGSGVHVNVTSYAGKVLLTGEVPTAAIREQIQKIASSTQYVQAVTNEILVGPETLIAARTRDTYITSKVKARLIEARQLDAKDVVVVTERGVVYLMGLVSASQGDAAAEVAASTSDVVRVVKLFEYRT